MRKSKKTSGRSLCPDEKSFRARAFELALFAFATTLFSEVLSRRNILRFFSYVWRRPLYFLLSFLIVLTTYALSLLFRRRRAVTYSVCAFWVLLSVANAIVCHDRTLPLTGQDIFLVPETISIITVYFTWWQLILMGIGVLVFIFAVIWVYRKLPARSAVRWVPDRLVFFALLLVCTACTLLLRPVSDSTVSPFADRIAAWQEYGFIPSFTMTFADKGIREPEEYSPEVMEEVLETLPEETSAPRKSYTDTEHPNIVFVQLESFFDVNAVKGVKYSRDPIPVWHSLLESCPNAALYVPTVGGGTANVEFEVLSGFNMDFFGAGETPYSSILKDTTCETLAYTLRPYGYRSTALHNNTGTFFSRNLVYGNLGFDAFLPLEYMFEPEYNTLGWAKDRMLTGEILRAMEADDARDLIFAITVESHGKYADTYELEEGDVEVLSMPEELYEAPFRNYINILPEVDAFIGDLIKAFETFDEPVVVILYGDHLPGIGLSEEMLSTNDFYASRYVIWNNYGAQFEAENLQAYRLSAELLSQLKLDGGVMTGYHQRYRDETDSDAYLEHMELLEYDLLYGERLAYGENGPYEPKELHLGVGEIEVDDVSLAYGRLLVTGSGFTPFSVIEADGRLLETIYISPAVLTAVYTQEEAPEALAVAQINNDGEELGRTEYRKG